MGVRRQRRPSRTASRSSWPAGTGCGSAAATIPRLWPGCSEGYRRDPGAEHHEGLAGGRGHRHAARLRRVGRAGGDDAEAGSVRRPSIRVPRPPRRPDQGDLVGRPGGLHVHEWLRREHGYDGSLRSVQRYWRRRYPAPAVRPLPCPHGEEASPLLCPEPDRRSPRRSACGPSFATRTAPGSAAGSRTPPAASARAGEMEYSNLRGRIFKSSRKIDCYLSGFWLPHLSTGHAPGCLASDCLCSGTGGAGIRRRLCGRSHVHTAKKRLRSYARNPIDGHRGDRPAGLLLRPAQPLAARRARERHRPLPLGQVRWNIQIFAEGYSNLRGRLIVI